MGFRGKPSPACERCRFRRLRCDLTRPSCSACVRAGVTCAGYRDQPVLAIRDESEQTIQKYYRSKQIHHKRQSAGNAPKSTIGDVRVQGVAADIPPQPLPQSLATQVQDLARGYLLSSYADPRSRYMSYLAPLLDKSHSEGLDAAVNAVALASLSNIHASSKLMVKARVEYASALRRTNMALTNANSRGTDQVLAAVIMLGMYEIISCTDAGFLDRWVQHLDGALRLLEIRDTKQLSRLEGLNMFRHLRTQLTISCLYQDRHYSPVLTRLNTHVAKHRDPHDMKNDELCMAMGRLADLIANVEEGTVLDPVEIIRTALCLDTELVLLVHQLPLGWRYSIGRVSEKQIDNHNGPALVWGSTYHLYDNLAAMATWNHYRSGRMLLSKLVIDTLTKIDTFYDNETQDAAAAGTIQRQALLAFCQQTTIDMIEGILESIPSCLGLGVPGQQSGMKCFGGLMLIWPLLLVAQSKFASRALMLWIANTLEIIGHHMGIAQALSTSVAIRQNANDMEVAS